MTPPRTLLLLGFFLAFLPLAGIAADNEPTPDELSSIPWRRPSTAKEWDALLAKAKVPPFEIPKSSVSFTQGNTRYHDWIKLRLIEPTRELVSGTAEEKRVNRLLDEFGDWFFGGRPMPKPYQALTAARAVANDPKVYPGLDYLVGTWLSRDNRRDAALKCFKKIAAAPTETQLPSIFRLEAQAFVLQHADNYARGQIGGAEERLSEIFREHVAEPVSDEDDARYILRIHLTAPLDAVKINREPRFIKYYLEARWPDWVRLTLRGDTELGLGWRAIGRNQVAVGKQAHEKAKGHYDRARKFFTAAWNLQPTEPDAAQRMIYIIRQGFGAEGETVRQWYDRVIAAEMDDPFAINAFLNASRIRFGGTPSELLGLARAFRDTNRYDTDFPTYFNKAISYLATDGDDWRALYRDSSIGRQVVETREKRIAALDPKDARGQLIHRSMLLVEAWAAGEFTKAVAARESLRNAKGALSVANEASDFCDNIDVDWNLACAEVAAHASPARAQWQRGHTALAAGRWEEARQAYKEGLALIKPAATPPPAPALAADDDKEVDKDDVKVPDNEALNLLKGEAAVADFQLAFAGGEWTPMPLHLRAAWKAAEGSMAWNEKAGRARFTSTWEFGKMLFRGSLGDSFEARGKFALSRPPSQKHGGIGVYFGHSAPSESRLSRFWYSARADYREPNELHFCVAGMYGSSSKLKKVEYQDENTFLFRREGGKVTFSVNGAPPFEYKLDDDAPGGEEGFGLGIIAWPVNSWMDAWSLEARKIKAP